MNSKVNPCPRCMGRFGVLGDICFPCREDQALERAMGVTIPRDLWPLEFQREFEDSLEEEEDAL